MGQAIADSGVPREEVFVTTKVWKAAWGAGAAKASVRESLGRLRTPYADLVLLHAPGDPALRAETWADLEDCVKEVRGCVCSRAIHAWKILRSIELQWPTGSMPRSVSICTLANIPVQGSVRAIGVSNFGVPHLKQLAETATVPPAVNQIELHPFLQWKDVTAYCREQGIVVEAYSPLCKGRKMEDPTLREVAAKLGVTPAQVLIRWERDEIYAAGCSLSPLEALSNSTMNRGPIWRRQLLSRVTFPLCTPSAPSALQVEPAEGLRPAGQEL